VWEYGEGQIDTQTAVTTVHFASAMPHAKCNKLRSIDECDSIEGIYA